MSKIPTLYIAYFAAEGLWNIDIIILFCKLTKKNPYWNVEMYWNNLSLNVIYTTLINSHNIQNQDIQDFMVNKTAPTLNKRLHTMSY